MQRIQIGEKPALDGLDLHQEVCGSLVRLWVMDGKSRVGKLTAVIQENNQVLLSDVEVEASMVARWFSLRRLIAKWYPKCDSFGGLEKSRQTITGLRENFLNPVWGQECHLQTELVLASAG